MPEDGYYVVSTGSFEGEIYHIRGTDIEIDINNLEKYCFSTDRKLCEQVVQLMNEAYKEGKNAKMRELRVVIGAAPK